MPDDKNACNPEFPASNGCPPVKGDFSPESIDRFFQTFPRVHFVLPRVGIKPDGQKAVRGAGSGWQRVKPPAVAVQTHLRTPPMACGDVTFYPALAVVPQSLSCLVIDVDDGGQATADRIQADFPAAWYFPSRRPGAGFHVWLPIEVETTPVSNGKWAAFGGAGDKRAGRGFLFLWYDLDKLRANLQEVGVSYRAADVQAAFPKPTPKPKPTGDYQLGDRNETLNERVFKAAKSGQPEQIEAECQAARDAGLPADEVSRTAASATAAGEAARQAFFAAKDSRALESALGQMGFRVRYDVRGCDFQVQEGAGDWVALHDHDVDFLREEVARRFFYRRSDKEVARLAFGRDGFYSALGAWVRREGLRIDPFMVYLEALPAWDEERRLGTLLYRTLGVEPDALGTWASIFPYLGAVQRTYEPGCRIKQSPVLIGPQTIGKSPFIEGAFPPAMQGPWFSDSLAYNSDSKTMVEATLGAVLVEFAELSAVRIHDREALKTYLAAPTDRVRLAYARRPEVLPRRFVVVFTSNNGQCLPSDPSGHSRFVPVTCTHGCNVEALLDAEREQLWAEALWLYRQGERANLPRDLEGVQAKATERARVRDSLEDQIAMIDEPGELTLDAIAKLLFLPVPIPPKDQGRLLEALLSQEWTRHHTKRGNFWRRPKRCPPPKKR